MMTAMEMCTPDPTERELQVCGEVKALLDKLDSAGPAAAGMAAFLRDEGIQGIPAHSSKCVIAEYLNAHLDDDYHVAVAARANVLGKHSGRYVIAQIPHTPERLTFLASFDLELYPELIKDVTA